MALFNKKTTTVSTNIPELQEYYASQSTESNAKAWFLAIGTLLVSIAVLGGLFFGGRWVYRKATKKKATSTAQVVVADDSTSSSTSTPSSTSKAATPTTPSTSAGSSSSSTSSTTTAPGVSPTQSAATNAAAQAATTTVPNTGPGNYLIAFFAAAFVGYLAKITSVRRQLKK
jgi:cytoskeletal protein RodZ